MDPRYSTPGLGLAKWINQIYKDEASNFWNEIQDQIVITSKSWSDGYGLFLEGESDLVLSYTTSPAYHCLLYTSPSPRDRTRSRMPSSA